MDKQLHPTLYVDFIFQPCSKFILVLQAVLIKDAHEWSWHSFATWQYLTASDTVQFEHMAGKLSKES